MHTTSFTGGFDSKESEFSRPSFKGEYGNQQSPQQLALTYAAVEKQAQTARRIDPNTGHFGYDPNKPFTSDEEANIREVIKRGEQSPNNPMYRLNDTLPWIFGGMLPVEREMYRRALNNPDPTDRDYINYLYGIMDWREARKRVAAYFDQKQRQSFIDYANGDPSVGQWLAKNIAAPAMNILSNAAGGFTSAAEQIQNTIVNAASGTNTPVSQYSYGGRMLAAAEDYADVFLKDMSPTAQFFAGNGLSIVNNIATFAVAALTKNPQLAAGLMAYEAGGQAAYDAGKRGATGTQQTWQALTTGAEEYLGERLSFGMFTKTLDAFGKKNLFDFIKQIAANVGVEGIEETATEIMNIISDIAVMGKGWGSDTQSQMADYFDKYLADHPEANNNDAFKATFWHALLQIAQAGASGMLGGLFLGGIGSVIQNFRNKSNSALTPAQAGTYNQGNEGAGDAGKKTIVIGETMKRVIDYAATINAEYYDGFNYYAKTKAMFGKNLRILLAGLIMHYGLSIKW